MQLIHNSIKAGHFHVHDEVQVLSADNMDILFGSARIIQVTFYSFPILLNI